MINTKGFKFSIENKAKIAYERRRGCGVCELQKDCTPAISNVCRAAFVEGYQKGYKQSKIEY